MVNDHSKYQRSMSDALDGELSGPELEALNVHLEESPDGADYWQRLQQVDDVLANTPQSTPSPGFVDRVMAAIAAIHRADLTSRKLGVGVALGLLVVAVIALPVLSALCILLWRAITDPGALHSVFQTVTGGASYAVGLAGDVGSRLERVATETPMIPALLTTVIPVSMLWAWLVWYLARGSQFMTEQQII